MSCSEPTKHCDSLELDIAKDIDAPTSRKSSNFLKAPFLWAGFFGADLALALML
jgi:hypothetical protein